uniref:Uncharacterized protein n=1 Tax=Corvus moneduloides TaxID=1196302 RepID=A0A8C3DIA5_CORMO
MSLCIRSLPRVPTEEAKASGSPGTGSLVWGDSPRISPDDVPHQQEERIPGRGAEVGAIDGDLDSGTEGCGNSQPHSSPHSHPNPGTFQPVVQVLQSEGQRAGVRAAEGGEEREGRHVVGLLEGPVVGGEGARQRHLAQRDDEVGEPEEHEDIEELEHDEVLVIGRLATIEREEALGIRAQLGDVAGVEGLERTQDTAGQARATPMVTDLIIPFNCPEAQTKLCSGQRQLKRNEQSNAPQLRKVEFHWEEDSRNFSGNKDSCL